MPVNEDREEHDGADLLLTRRVHVVLGRPRYGGNSGTPAGTLLETCWHVDELTDLSVLLAQTVPALDG